MKQRLINCACFLVASFVFVCCGLSMGNRVEDAPVLSAPSEEIDPSEWFEEVLPTEPEPEPTEPASDYPPENVEWYSSFRVYATGTLTTHIWGEEIDREFLAKLLFLEAGIEDWWGQVYTCSAILNHCEASRMTLWQCGHDGRHFDVAPYVDGAKPSKMSYEVVDYVLGGGRIEGISYFRTKKYHSFGTPICKVGSHYFSM